MGGSCMHPLTAAYYFLVTLTGYFLHLSFSFDFSQNTYTSSTTTTTIISVHTVWYYYCYYYNYCYSYHTFRRVLELVDYICSKFPHLMLFELNVSATFPQPVDLSNVSNTHTFFSS